MNPDLSVIICTVNRPVLLRRAIDAIRSQTADAVIETIVVFDRVEPDHSLEDDDRRRPVRVTKNTCTPGLPGGRNAGVAIARAPLVAFCDDDDAWFPEKAARQLAFLAAQPDVDVVVSGIEIATKERTIDRALDCETVTFDDLLRSRVMEANFCTAMVRRDAFLHEIGPADEHIPGGYCEDYEWVLRAAKLKPIAVVPEPLVRIEWAAPSHFKDRWKMLADALAYLLERFPEFNRDPRGLARIRGQRAFAFAAVKERRHAWDEIRATVRADWREPRAYLAALVTMGLSADFVVRMVAKRGRGM